MRKGNHKKLKKRTMGNRFANMMRRFSKTEIILSAVLIATILAIILLIVIKMSSTGKSLADVFGNTQADSEEMATGGLDQNAAADDEVMPVVETATEGMKSESTPDTTVLAKKEGAKDGYLNRCVFLGDSRTVAMVNYGFFNDDAALAQIGISHPAFASNKFINNAGKEYTLKSYMASHQAPVIYILLGVNGINDPSEDHYRNTFIKLIDSVAGMAPNSNIVLVAIGPVDDNGIYKNNVQNALIDKYNKFLLETAKEKHVFYLDIAEILKGSDGQVKSEYNGGDGLHYSGKGCEAIFRYIVEHPVPGISDEGEYVVKYIKPDPNRMKVTMDSDSGIDEGKLQELMDMMMGNTENEPVSDANTQSSEETEEELRKKEEEEAKKKAEEEEKKKAEEEEKKKEEERKKAEEEAKKKAEEEEKKKAEEEEKKKEEERKKAEEEEKKKAEEEEKKKAEEENKEDETEKEEDESEKKEDNADNGSSSTEGGEKEETPGQSEGETENNQGGD